MQDNQAQSRREGRWADLARHRAWLAAVPIVIVNYVAFRAQLRFWQDWLDRPDAFLVSVALESIAVYLAWMAHLALVSDDSALRLRLAAYAMALLIGVLNYSHYMRPGWQPTVAAVTFGLMSAISPWLWSVYSRRRSRDQLKALNRIDEPSVRLGAVRWFFHPRWSLRVMRHATWVGLSQPARAILLFGPVVPKYAQVLGSYREAAEPQSAEPQASPPDPSLAGEPPLPEAAAAATAREAPVRDLPSLSPDQQRVARELIERGTPLPGVNALARMDDPAFYGSETTRKRSSRKVLIHVKAGLNGHAPGSS